MRAAWKLSIRGLAARMVGLYMTVGILAAESNAGDPESRHDYLGAAVEFADAMLEHGRDRYGPVESPLFAVLLTREDRPRIGPCPIFDTEVQYEWQKKLDSPFRRFNYNRCLNYPAGLGREGPHKVTMHGCDISEDRDLYVMLIDLSRMTGELRFRAEAEKALRWWFTKTMGPADLYPWGEHLGWDFERECPTYFEGPSKHLFAACYHEIKDTVPFLDFLADLPATEPGERTRLEKYALGVWNAHYWDQERGIYCRHGDYTGQDQREGSLAGFPAHQGAHLRLWVKTCLTAKDREVKRRMEEILGTVLDVQISRARKFGYIPFTFDPDVNGKAPKPNGQSDRLGCHAAELAVETQGIAPAISAKFSELAELLLGEGRGEATVAASSRPPAVVADLSAAHTSGRHGEEIIRRVDWFRQYGDQEYLRAAEQQAHMAYLMFCDDTSPLPKAFAGALRKTLGGEDFPDFYFRGAKLMHAFALLGEALEQTSRGPLAEPAD